MIAIETLRALMQAGEEHGWDNDLIGEPLVGALPCLLDVVEKANEAAAALLIAPLALSLGRLDDHFRESA